jgi:hypothetical protein
MVELELVMADCSRAKYFLAFSQECGAFHRIVLGTAQGADDLWPLVPDSLKQGDYMRIDHFWLVQPVTEGGWGFNITDQKGHPLIEFRYSSQDEANTAARNVQRAIVNAISIRPLTK